jgi:sterol desaturase/sphingolipid hydroxylase (fatty acid hydroxylase superfamily)
MSIIQASIPLFFLLLGIELAHARLSGNRLLRLNDSISDLSLGTLSQLSGLFFKILTIGAYIWVADHFAIQRFLFVVPAWLGGLPFTTAAGIPWFGVRIPELLTWTVAFVLVDLAYYWSHRMSHEVHVLWAGHVVHHSSEEYNLAVALRQSSLHGLMSWVFYIPLALIGLPWQMFVTCNALNLVYQFWIHTRAVGRLGWVTEAVLNTPSHHRVHHGVNPKYQDRNYAGVFITWDKLFGTFVREEEEPVYGITHPLASWNPLWANVHVFVEIWHLARRARGWRSKLKVVFGPPSWRPDDGGLGAQGAEGGAWVLAPDVTVDNFQKFDPVVPRAISWYAFVQFLVVLVAAVKTLALAGSLPLTQTGALVFYLALALTNIGGLLEGERWGFVLEQARLLSLVAATGTLLVVGSMPRVWVAIALVWFAGSAVWLWAIARGQMVDGRWQTDG